MIQEVKVEGMTCGGCANAVKTKFTSIPNVNNVKIDLENKKAVLDSEKQISVVELTAALEGTSYSVI